MDYNQRKSAVWANVLKPMTIMMSPPRHLASNEEGKKLYLETLFDAINGQLPPEMEVEEFNHACQTLSKRLIEKTTISCLLYTSPSPRDATLSRMPSSA